MKSSCDKTFLLQSFDFRSFPLEFLKVKIIPKAVIPPQKGLDWRDD